MSSRDLTEAMILYRMDPWDEQRMDLGFGVVAATIANCNRNPEKRSEPFIPADFMPYEALRQASADAGKSEGDKLGDQILKAVTAMGGKIIEKKKKQDG